MPSFLRWIFEKISPQIWNPFKMESSNFHFRPWFNTVWSWSLFFQAWMVSGPGVYQKDTCHKFQWQNCQFKELRKVFQKDRLFWQHVPIVIWCNVKEIFKYLPIIEKRRLWFEDYKIAPLIFYAKIEIDRRICVF